MSIVLPRICIYLNNLCTRQCLLSHPRICMCIMFILRTLILYVLIKLKHFCHWFPSWGAVQPIYVSLSIWAEKGRGPKGQRGTKGQGSKGRGPKKRGPKGSEGHEGCLVTFLVGYRKGIYSIERAFKPQQSCGKRPL